PGLGSGLDGECVQVLLGQQPPVGLPSRGGVNPRNDWRVLRLSTPNKETHAGQYCSLGEFSAHASPDRTSVCLRVGCASLFGEGSVTGHRSATGEPGGTVRSIARWRSKRHNGAMPSVQIKDVPEHTHEVLGQRAAAAHQSLQEYLRTKLIQEASAPTVEEVLDRAGGRAGGRVPIKTATEILREDRDRR